MQVSAPNDVTTDGAMRDKMANFFAVSSGGHWAESLISAQVGLSAVQIDASNRHEPLATNRAKLSKNGLSFRQLCKAQPLLEGRAGMSDNNVPGVVCKSNGFDVVATAAGAGRCLPGVGCGGGGGGNEGGSGGVGEDKGRSGIRRGGAWGRG